MEKILLILGGACGLSILAFIISTRPLKFFLRPEYRKPDKEGNGFLHTYWNEHVLYRSSTFTGPNYAPAIVVSVSLFLFVLLAFVAIAEVLDAPLAYDEDRNTVFNVLIAYCTIMVAYPLIRYAVDKMGYERHAVHKKDWYRAFVAIALYVLAAVAYRLCYDGGMSPGWAQFVAILGCALVGVVAFIQEESIVRRWRNCDPVLQAFHRLLKWESLEEETPLHQLLEEKIEHRKKYSPQINETENSPEAVAFFLATSYLAHKLTHGGYYVYRGVLSMQGSEIFKLYKTLIANGVTAEILPQHIADELLTSLKQRIAENG